jgi:hypothetical protein
MVDANLYVVVGSGKTPIPAQIRAQVQRGCRPMHQHYSRERIVVAVPNLKKFFGIFLSRVSKIRPFLKVRRTKAGSTRAVGNRIFESHADHGQDGH